MALCFGGLFLFFPVYDVAQCENPGMIRKLQRRLHLHVAIVGEDARPKGFDEFSIGARAKGGNLLKKRENWYNIADSKEPAYHKVCTDRLATTSDDSAILGFEVCDLVAQDKLDTAFTEPLGNVPPPTVRVSTVQRQGLTVDDGDSFVLIGNINHRFNLEFTR
jgi:hypothetical protein